MSPILRIWHHQALRTIRFGSFVDTLLSVIVKGGVLIGTLLFGIAFLILLPQVTRETVVAEGLSAFLNEYLFTLVVLTFLLNTWAFTSAGTDLSRYRSYPVPLRRLAAVVLVVRALHVRYLSMGLAAVIVFALVTRDVGPSAVIVTALFILLLDATSVLLRIALGRRGWAFAAVPVSLLGITLFDQFGGGGLSALAFAKWINWAAGSSLSLMVPLAITCVLVAASHRRIQSMLRYGS